MSEKLRVMFKRMDHLERAFRREEKPLLVKDFEEQQKADKQLYDAKSNETKKVARESFEQNLSTKKRLQRIQPAYVAFRADVEAKAAEQHKELERKANEAIEAEIAERKAEDAEQKRLEKEHEDAQRSLAEAKEAEIAQAEEVERKKREALMADKERSEAEANQRRAEREAERKKTEEIVRKQNEREEAALKKQREATFQKTGSVWGGRTPSSTDSGASTPTSAGAPPAGSWMARRRQAEAEGKLSRPSSTAPPPPPSNPAARSSRAPPSGQEKPGAFGSMRRPEGPRPGAGAPPPNPQRSRW